MKQQIMCIAMTAFLSLESISAAALPAAQTEVMPMLLPTPCPDGEPRERMFCASHTSLPMTAQQSAAPTLPKRDEPAHTTLPTAYLGFFDELDALFVKYEDIIGRNETTSTTPQADEKHLQARDIFNSIGDDLKQYPRYPRQC